MKRLTTETCVMGMVSIFVCVAICGSSLAVPWEDATPFTNLEAALKELAEAQLGLSVVVSGLFDEVAGCCGRAGTGAHTVNHSLGFWGRTEKLPAREILEVTTMCGHGLVAPSLVWHFVESIRRGHLSGATACQEMRKMCICDIFNHARAEGLMAQLVEAVEERRLTPPDASRGGAGHPRS